MLTQLQSGSKEVSKVDALFDSYKAISETQEDLIGPIGVEALCRDLGIDTGSRSALLLCHKMNASRMGYFTRDEFRRGFQQLSATSLAQLKKALPKLENDYKETYALKSLHSFAFTFLLTEPGQKIIETSSASQMLSLVLPDGPFTERLVAYLHQQEEYSKISADQWNQFLRFSLEVSPDFANYDENSAWPVILDAFVEVETKGWPDRCK